MKVTLALGGGAGLGWAHIGLLRALEEKGVEVAAIAGTSIGAITGACFGAGKLDILEEIALSANLRTILRYIDPHVRRGAWIGGKQIESQLEEHLGGLTFEDLSLPLAAIASDLVTGETVIIRSGPLVPAIRASMSLPGIFKPVLAEGRMLVDGGTSLPVPVGPARALAPDLPCIAVSLQSDYLARARATGIASEGRHPTSLSVVKAAVGLSLSNLARYSLALDPPDMLMALPVGHIEIQNFTRAEELISIGRAETEARWPEIEAMLNNCASGAA